MFQVRHRNCPTGCLHGLYSYLELESELSTFSPRLDWLPSSDSRSWVPRDSVTCPSVLCELWGPCYSDGWRAPLPGKDRKSLQEHLLTTDTEWKVNETLELVSISWPHYVFWKAIKLHVKFYWVSGLSLETLYVRRVWKGLVKVWENSWQINMHITYG